MSKKGISESDSAVIPKARKDTHKVILDWLSMQERGSLFDAPAGYGHLSMHLKNMGYQVVCGEVEPDIFRVKDIECIYTDLNVAIPMPDGSFDYVCCVDGLEHMTDPYRAVSELARVLKPGGIAIFALPNYSNIEKRFRYFWRGYVTRPKTLEDYQGVGSNVFNFHNTTMPITILDLLFAINGLRVETILQDKVKGKQYFFLPLLLILKLEASLSGSRSRERHRSDLTLRREVILGGNDLIFIARKG